MDHKSSAKFAYARDGDGLDETDGGEDESKDGLGQHLGRMWRGRYETCDFK